MSKPVKRCEWCEGSHDLYIEYHDKEWGVPVYDDRTQFEFLVLEGAQAGLSWSTILNRREGYRRAFANFDAEVVAGYDERKVLELLQNTEIIRNQLKVRSAINNAQMFLKIAEEKGSFTDFIWSFVDGKPIINHWKTISEIPATTELSDTISKDLKKRGFKFVGSTIIYAHMQATGLVNDHEVDCFRYPDLVS